MTKSLKIKKLSAPDLVCEEIKRLISQGTWKCYQKIPSENELAETFGVNRLTVRMALQKLNTLGVLDTRVGDGTYVCRFNFDQHIEEISEFYRAPGLLDDVAEFRMLVEVECARLAIQRGTLEELEELRCCCVRFEETFAAFFRVLNDPAADAKKQAEAFALSNEADLAFHNQICIMAHNALLLYSFSVAKPTIREYMLAIGKNRVPNIMVEGRNTSVQDHWDMYHAIERKDFEACRKLYVHMIDYNNLAPTNGSSTE